MNTNVGDMPLDIFSDYVSDALEQEWRWEYLVPAFAIRDREIMHLDRGGGYCYHFIYETAKGDGFLYKRGDGSGYEYACHSFSRSIQANGGGSDNIFETCGDGQSGVM